jgi:5-methylthioadenosine/S-adenosylhomocysteine deaminase
VTDILIQNGAVLHVAANQPAVEILPDHDVIVKGNRIEAVLPTGNASAGRFREVIDARGRLVMPGLINTHAHVPMVIFRGLAEDVNIDRWFNDFMWPLESNLQSEDVYWGMQLGLAEMIRAGVTSVADHYFFTDRAAQAVEEAGTRALLGWAMFGSQGQAMIEQTARFAREYNGAADGRIKTIMAPHAPYTCDDDFLRETARTAQRFGLGVHIHAAETMDQTRASLDKRGQTPIQVLQETGILDAGALVAHAIGLNQDDIRLMARSGARVAHAPKTYLKLAMDVTPVVDLREAGVPVGLATDGAVSNNTLDLWESMRLMALLQKDRTRTPEQLTIPEALYIATRESARVIGMADSLGAVEPGYLADLIVVDLNGLHHQPLHSITTSLVYNVMASDVQTVIVDGRVLMKNRALLTLNEGEIVRNVRENAARLTQRHPDQRIQTYNP